MHWFFERKKLDLLPSICRACSNRLTAVQFAPDVLIEGSPHMLPPSAPLLRVMRGFKTPKGAHRTIGERVLIGVLTVIAVAILALVTWKLWMTFVSL